MIILSHRGLDLDRLAKTAESSLAAFYSAAQEDFGIEIDLQLAPGGEIVIWHDFNVARWSQGHMQNKWPDLSPKDFQHLENKFGNLCRWREVVDLARRHPHMRMAIHVKAYNQNDGFFFHLRRELGASLDLHKRMIVFDLQVPWAERLRAEFPSLGLAASVVHPYDRARFNAVAGGTLLESSEVLHCRHAYDWAWLDEWDLLNNDGGHKVLYEQKLVTQFKNAGFSVAAISPELHRNEDHPDGAHPLAVEKRWRRMFDLGLDAICTDYPSRLKEFKRICEGERAS